MKITRRNLHKLYKIIKNTRINKDSIRFLRNLIKIRSGKFKKDSGRDIPHPTTLMLELTNKCNLHCVTCPREYDFGRQMEIGNMETELAKKIVDSAYPYLQTIGLTGMGETLFAPNLMDVARYIKSLKKNILIFISTNANIPDFIGRITPVLPYIDTVQISTDGIGEGYERVRKGASFRMLEENLKKLVPLAKSNDVDLMFNMVITKLNYMQMGEVVEYAQRMGVRYVNFTYFNLVSVTGISEEYYSFFKSEEFNIALKQAKQSALKCKDVEVTGLDFLGNPGIRKCPLMWGHFQINHDGEVPPCCAKPFSKEYSFGNVGIRPLMEVLNGKKAKAFRESWIKGVPNSFCRRCHFVNL